MGAPISEPEISGGKNRRKRFIARNVEGGNLVIWSEQESDIVAPLLPHHENLMRDRSPLHNWISRPVHRKPY